MSGYRGMLGMGLLGLLHSAYSAAEWRSFDRQEDTGDSMLPVDIVLQTLICLIVSMVGVLHIAGEFKEIRATVDLETQSWENLRNRPSFYTWAHRGRAFSREYEPPKSATTVKNLLDIPDKFLS